MRFSRRMQLILVAGGIALLASTAGFRAQTTTTSKNYGIRAAKLARAYDLWKRALHADQNTPEMIVALGWFRGYSVQRSRAVGRADIDADRGSVAVEVYDIDMPDATEVWLIDNHSGASAMPDALDEMILLGNLSVRDRTGRLAADLGPDAFRDFDVDRIVVARRGQGPIDGGVLYGSPSLFDRLFRRSNRAAKGLAPVARQGAPGDFTTDFGRSAGRAVDSPEALLVFQGLESDGENLFMNETFNGNGRTCATCHHPENNFTVDADFIATLPANNPLFVAEVNPDLNHELNGGLFFENPVLMRAFGLIVTNPDGFDDLSGKFAMRSTNHTFAQALQLEPSRGDQTTIPPLHRLGWGGDGAPGSGTLREFAIGAVTQHGPLTLNRVEGVDFRLPTDEELDAIEAFQLTLGRQEELDLASMTFLDPAVDSGKRIFNRADTRCDGCHSNGGALRPPGAPGAGTNFTIDTGLRFVVHPGEPLGEPMPFDDGFGFNPAAQTETGPGLNMFNTSSLVEAADTAPFFHDHSAATIEEAVDFYNSIEFNDMSFAGQLLQIRNDRRIDLTPGETNDVAAFLRAINVLENIRMVEECDLEVLTIIGRTASRARMRVCRADNEDAVQVLTGGPLVISPTAVTHLETALDLQQQALDSVSRAARNSALNAALVELAAARDEMLAP